MKRVVIVFISILLASTVNAQIADERVETAPINKQSDYAPPLKKMIDLKDIWKDYTFSSETVRGVRSMNDGKNYTVLERGKSGINLVQYNYKTGKKVATIIEAKDLTFDGKELRMQSYEFSSDEKKVLIGTEVEAIYRRSSKANFFVYDLKSKNIEQLAQEEKQMYADFSPSGNKLAYVMNNNLFFKDFTTNKVVQITEDGEFNKIINGASDWVYEEELELSKAFQWSVDGQKLAFYRFDEAAVKQWNMKMYDNLYPSDYKFKYPKAGEENAKVQIKIFDLASTKTTNVDLGTDYEYIPSIEWTKDANTLAVISSNRHQSEVKINLVNASTGKANTVHTEKSDTYIEMPFDVHFMADQKHFILLSEKSGYRHLYLHNIDGSLKNKITNGDWPVTDYYGINEGKGIVYYQSAETSPLDRNVYSIKLDGTGKNRLTKKDGTNSADFSNSFSYFINYHTTANTPNYLSLNNSTGNVIRVLKDNQKLTQQLGEYEIGEKTFFSFKTSQDVELNAWIIKPPNFDKNKKYPVFLTIYGGPGSQTVTNSWGGSNFFWHQLLAQKGYIVVSVDNRGTGARGVDFKKVTYKQLGKYETEDQIEAAKYFSSLPYVDSTRIGVQGWSYGGYMSSLCLLKGADYFKAAIAVAPVTNWRFYDSIYTERYMQTPQENEDGYDDNSPINHVEKLKGKYLLVHGMADDNVHLQNTTEMISALVDADKQFDLFAYPNKNHGIYGGNTRYHLYSKMTNFVLENL
ncbi:S9 family peptidase [Vicingaceae bacterium]|nr:S9 family peptidase [Vicingaceae bacterium]MDC1451286.1 S9 family peptidase [Vicingaceae bacterium]